MLGSPTLLAVRFCDGCVRAAPGLQGQRAADAADEYSWAGSSSVVHPDAAHGRVASQRAWLRPARPRSRQILSSTSRLVSSSNCLSWKTSAWTEVERNRPKH